MPEHPTPRRMVQRTVQPSAFEKRPVAGPGESARDSVVCGKDVVGSHAGEKGAELPACPEGI